MVGSGRSKTMEMILATESTLRDLALMNGLRKLQYEKMIEGMNAVRKEEVYKDGERVVVEYPDYNVQHKFWSDSLRVTGDIKPEVAVDNRKVSITIPASAVGELLGMVKDVNGQLRKLKEEGHQTGEVIDVEAI